MSPSISITWEWWNWDEYFTGYGDGSAAPVPADYDGDSRADLAIKTANGEWNIDFSSGCGRQIGTVVVPCFGAFNVYRTGYGNSAATPIPADYNGDGRADLAIKSTDGYFGVDYWSPSYPHYHGWNVWPQPGYGDANWIAIPGKYHLGSDLVIDMAQKRKQTVTVDQYWYVDHGSNGFPGVDVVHRLRQ